MDHPQRRKLESLIGALCDGVIEPEQLAELEQSLRDSAECRRLYLQYVDVHARLSVHPHLTTGIPLAAASTATPAADDLVLARAAEGNQPASRGKPFRSGRWLTLSLVLLAAFVAWGVRDRWLPEANGPVVVEAVGPVTIESDDGRSPAETGRTLRQGERLKTADDESHAVLEYPDGTRVAVYFASQVEVPSGSKTVHLRLLSGSMEVDAAPQPPDRPLIFATDHARYVVVGTRFRLYRESNASRLELDEGKVRLERRSDGESVDVTAGWAAVTTAGSTPVDIQPLAAGRGELLTTLKKAGEAVTFSEAGQWLATGDWQRGLKTWTPGERAPRDVWNGKPGRSDGFVFSGNRLTYVNRDGKQGGVTLWQPGTADALRIPLPGENARSRALSPDGRYVAESANDGTCVYAIDASKGRLSRHATLPDKGKAWCLSLTRKARRAAAGFWDGTVRIYELAATGRPDAEPSARIAFTTKLAHTPTKIALTDAGERLAVFTRKDGLLLIDPLTGRRESLWAAGAASVTCLKFATDGRRLLAGLSDGTARMWSVDDGRMLLVVDLGHTPSDVAWSPAASLLVTANGAVELWKCTIP